MSSTTAWFTLQDMVDEYCFTNIVDFEHHMRTQDIDLQIQLQKNANLRTRVYNYINAKRMLETEKSILNNGAMDRAVARKEIDKAVEKKLVSFEYAQKQIENLYAQK